MSWIFSEIGAILLTAVGGAAMLLLHGWRSRVRTRKEIEGENAAETLDRFKKAQDAKRDSSDDPNESVRGNDKYW